MDFSDEMMDEIFKIFQIESEEIISRINNCNYFYKIEYITFSTVIGSFLDVKNEISEFISKRDNYYNIKNGRIY